MTRTLYEYGLAIEESRIHLKSDRKKAISEAINEIKLQRQELARYVRDHPDFQFALEPIQVTSDAPECVRIMDKAARLANVGPMASVAGALADMGLQAMISSGAKMAVVENGGEIAAFTESQPLHISIISASQDISGKIGLLITKDDSPIGVATSSSRTGHAVSFGEADSATAVAEKAALADAAATAICNSVVGVDIEASIQLGLRKSKEIQGVRGAIIIREGRVGLAGKLPKIVGIKEK